MNFMKMTSALVLGLASLTAHAADSETLDWPSRTVTWVVGFSPGGTADVLTRIAAEHLSRATGRTVLVENRAGASGAIALQYVARGGPGSGMLITVPGPLIYPSEQPTIGEQLVPVGLMAEGPMVMVGPKGGPESLSDVLAQAKADPSQWSYASSGTGTSQHLAGELLNQMAGTELLHVPYKGGGQAVTDVVGGQIPLAILGPTPVMPHIRSGALLPYAVTSTYRIDRLPEVPTMAQAGLPDYDATQWFVTAASADVTTAQATQMNGVLREIFKSDAFQEALANAGMIAGDGTPDDLLVFLADDQKKWDALIEEAGLSLQ